MRILIAITNADYGDQGGVASNLAMRFTERDIALDKEFWALLPLPESKDEYPDLIIKTLHEMLDRSCSKNEEIKHAMAMIVNEDLPE